MRPPSSILVNSHRSSSSILVIVVTLLDLLVRVAATQIPDRSIKLPENGSFIKLRSLESGGYLGVSASSPPHFSKPRVSADHYFCSSAGQFEVHYAEPGFPSDPITLAVTSVGGTGSSSRAFLSFDEAGQPTVRERTAGAGSKPANTTFMFSGWPVIRNETESVLFAGPYYRLHLVDERPPHPRIATVGADYWGRVTLYPADEELLRGEETLAAPPTLFLLHATAKSSPGDGNCHKPPPAARLPKKRHRPFSSRKPKQLPAVAAAAGS